MCDPVTLICSCWPVWELSAWIKQLKPAKSIFHLLLIWMGAIQTTIVNIAAIVLKLKALKLGNWQFGFLKMPFKSYLISSGLVFCLWYKLNEVTFESRNGNTTGSQNVVTVCSIVWKLLNPKRGSVLFENIIEIMSSALSHPYKRKWKHGTILNLRISWACHLTNKFLLILSCLGLSVSLLKVPFCARWVLCSVLFICLDFGLRQTKILLLSLGIWNRRMLWWGGEKKDGKYG